VPAAAGDVGCRAGYARQTNSNPAPHSSRCAAEVKNSFHRAGAARRAYAVCVLKLHALRHGVVKAQEVLYRARLQATCTPRRRMRSRIFEIYPEFVFTQKRKKKGFFSF
jgi:hypothetical protein